MTKKIFNRLKGKTDILVADPGVEGFVSLKTGERYDEAQVSYKAVVFTPETLVERARKSGMAVSAESAEYTLRHVDAFKTGTKVRHVADDKGEVRFTL